MVWDIVATVVNYIAIVYILAFALLVLAWTGEWHHFRYGKLVLDFVTYLLIPFAVLYCIIRYIYCLITKCEDE